ncbi:MAG: hypothetical protein ACOYK9_04655, partial [Chlamydiia bacterium]
PRTPTPEPISPTSASASGSIFPQRSATPQPIQEAVPSLIEQPPFSKEDFIRTEVPDDGSCLFHALKLCLQAQVPGENFLDTNLRAVFVERLILEKENPIVKERFPFEVQEYIKDVIDKLIDLKNTVVGIELANEGPLSAEQIKIMKEGIDSSTNPIARPLLSLPETADDIPDIQEFLDNRIQLWEQISENLWNDLPRELYDQLIDKYIKEIQNPRQQAGLLALILLADRYEVQIHYHTTPDPEAYPKDPIMSFGPETGPQIHLIYDSTRFHYQALLPVHSPQAQAAESSQRSMATEPDPETAELIRKLEKKKAKEAAAIAEQMAADEAFARELEGL